MATAAKGDYYNLLGVKRGASTADVRKAYKRLARKFHPDVNPGDTSAEERFKQIQEAYDVLSDAKKRKMYDQHGFYSDHFQPAAGAGGAGYGGFDFGGFDFSEFTPKGSNFRDIFSDFFTRFGGGGAAGSAPGPQRGSDLEYQVEIDFWEAIGGTVRTLTISRQEACTACRGRGTSGGPAPCAACGGKGKVTQAAGPMRFNITCTQCGGVGRLRTICRHCNGEGRQPQAQRLEVRIPAGVSDGSRVRVAAKGNAGIYGGASGDLYIITQVRPHPFFERRGDDIYTVVPITVSEAALGARIEVPTIDGRALLKVPTGTQSGQRFRLREKGAASLRTGTRGDQYVEVRIVLPKVLDERQKEMLKDFARLTRDDPRAEIYEAAAH